MISSLSIDDLASLNILASNFNISYDESVFSSDVQKIICFKVEDKIVGYIDFSIYYERAEVNYIFVLDEYRKKGIASKLLEYLFSNYNLENITLEVRESNLSAIKFYEKNGFVKCSIRKNYYGNEDALLYIKKFGD